MLLKAQGARPRWMWGMIAAMWLVLVSVAAAQTNGVRIIDPDGLLGGQQNAVQQAAQQLANEGAQVIVVAAEASKSANGQTPQQFLDATLSQNGFASRADQLQPTQIVYYILYNTATPAQSFTGFYYGSSWRRVLDPVSTQIRNERITAEAGRNGLANGFIAGINATRTTINPPTSPFVYVLGGVLALTVVGLVAAPIVQRRRATATALSTARDQAAQARREAGAAIADLARRMDDARAKAQYDAFSYAPADVQRVQALQREAEQTFTDAQAAFDAAEEQERLAKNADAGTYERVAAQYMQGRELTQQAAAALTKAEQLRATLDAQRTTNSPSS